ncbi:MAG TPA: fatty acyl-AMP ligase [Kofleriaceae bacterium]|jgi:acyl-CoA synthetase (AMP-forming)/AMP-acid ligase II
MRETFVDIVREQADVRGDETWLRYLETGDVAGTVTEVTYGTLEERARAIAVEILRHCRPGDRALLMYPSGVEFVTAFVGCWFAGVIPVPAYPPDLARPARSLAKIHAIAADCGARIALTTSEILPIFARIAPPEIKPVATDTCRDSDAWGPPAITGTTTALLQYTSGSTGSPKGVVVSHANLLANERSIEAAMGPVKLVVGWLPIFHDMGLLGNVLQALHAGTGLVLMSPVSFLKRPARWLEAISHYKATTSGAPNFAFDLCVRRVTDQERQRLDLRSWEVACCGAEPVRAATYRRFLDRFEPVGFSRTAFYPCFGLAEATLFVTGNRRDTPVTTTRFAATSLEHGQVRVTDSDDDARTLVSCGVPAPSEQVRIVDPDRCVPTEGVGEIWVRGPGVANGYWGRDASETFAARLADGDGPYLRTGDLGFLYGGELYVTGRSKDMIIIGGRNLFPQDIESAIEGAVPAVRKGCCAAFSVDEQGEERLCIMAEHDGAPDTENAIKRVVAEQFQVAVFDVALVAKGELPKTSSGKLERHACRRAHRRTT